jgi:glycosyltransferase involved in cell wall biosynthesis
MPCYNASRYLEKSVRSLINQVFSDWELIIVNDGSTDNSKEIANELMASDSRIKVVSKSNGGYVSARLFGYKQIDPSSKYLLFYDADDRLHEEMLQSLYAEMEMHPRVGAVYCNHVIIDEADALVGEAVDMPRYIPTRFWVKKLPESVVETPFISIFCWTKMIEPMTLLRRVTYEETPGWDISFGKGQGNIGEGVYLFSELALSWKVHYLNRPLYYYRRHSQQMTSVAADQMNRQANKVIEKWQIRVNEGLQNRRKIQLAIVFFRYRLSAFSRLGSLKHNLRYVPHRALIVFFLFVVEYTRSLRLVFSHKELLDHTSVKNKK